LSSWFSGWVYAGGNRTARGAETQQILASVLRTLDQRGLEPTDALTPLLQARQPIVAPPCCGRRRPTR
jgi:hypothetical protein